MQSVRRAPAAPLRRLLQRTATFCRASMKHSAARQKRRLGSRLYSTCNRRGGVLMRFMIVNAALLVSFALAFGRGPARAEESAATPDTASPETIELSFSAAPEPRPALKYRLFPGLAERTAGNAATYYYRALVQQKMRPPEYWKEYDNRSEAWLTKDAAQYPKKEVHKWLAQQQVVLSQLKTAVYRERCDWDLRVQDL